MVHGSTAARLWLIWPPNQTNKVVHDGQYGHSDGVLQRLDHGRFAVQLDGESIFVPAGWLHCVLTLNTSVLCGSDVEGLLSQNLPSIQAEIAAGTDREEAVAHSLNGMRNVLVNGTGTERERVVGQFLVNLSRDHRYLRDDHGCWRQDLIEMFSDHNRMFRRCILCVVTGSTTVDTARLIDSSDHIIREHFEHGASAGNTGTQMACTGKRRKRGRT